MEPVDQVREERPGPQPPGNLTERSRVILERARAEAAALGHEYVGTEHLLLALAAHRGGVSAAVLDNLGVDVDALRARLLGLLQRGTARSETGARLPFTTRARRVLDLSGAESRELHHVYVGSEHLLLGLVREETGIAAQVLAEAGVKLEGARAETLRLLGNAPDAPPSAPSGSRPIRRR